MENMDSCFCHFNGFRVKDAEARELIKNISSFKETNNGNEISFWVGTRAQYEEIEQPAENCLYIITDGTSGDDLETMLKEIEGKVTEATAAANAATQSAGAATQASTSAIKAAGEAKNTAGAALSAANEAKNATDIAIDTLYGTAPYDVVGEFWEDDGTTSKITFSTAEATGFQLTTKIVEAGFFLRYKQMGLIFCAIQFKMQGIMEKGEVLPFNLSSKYHPEYSRDGAVRNLRYPLVHSGIFTDLPICAQIDMDTIYITALDDIDTSDYGSGVIATQFFGWYPYNTSVDDETE